MSRRCDRMDMDMPRADMWAEDSRRMDR